MLEGFLGETSVEGCAGVGLAWLADCLGVQPSACVVRLKDAPTVTVVATHNMPHAQRDRLAAQLDPGLLVSTRLPIKLPCLPQIHRAGSSQLVPTVVTSGEDAYEAVPLPTPARPLERAWLVVPRGRRRRDFAWFTTVFGHAVAPYLHPFVGVGPGAARAFDHWALRGVLEAVGDPVVMTQGEDAAIVLANRPALALFGPTGPSERDSDDCARAIARNNRVLAAALTGQPPAGDDGSRDLALVDPRDGSERLYELVSTTSDDGVRGPATVAVLRDVTALRRAGEAIEAQQQRLQTAGVTARTDSERLNLIINSVADPIIVTEASGATSLMNEPAARLFSLNAPGEALRQVQSNEAQFSSFISGILESHDRRRVGVLLLTDPHTGAALPMEAIAGTILAESGELNAIVTILHDRREALENAHLYEQLKEASDELERKVQAATADIAEQNELLRRQALELEQASAMKSQFLANMSHEFRTPLNAILGYTSMLLQGVAGPLEAAPRRHLSRVESNGRHLLAIINEILDISRIEAGRMPLQLTSFRLADLLVEVRAELEPIIARTPVPVVLDIDRDLPLVQNDRQKVKQIVLNLLSNALKFTHAGKVTLQARRQDTEPAVDIAVIDTGIGIPTADQARIFDDFLQLDNSPTRPYGGTGLGLSICRRLAQMIGARLMVQSRVGHGSTFTMTLPIQGRK